jgi:hypothetical protein
MLEQMGRKVLNWLLEIGKAAFSEIIVTQEFNRK